VTTATLPILEAVVVVVAAPIAGVALCAHRHRVASRAVGVFGFLLVASAVWTMSLWGWSAAALRIVCLSHAMLAITGLAFAALGAWCRAALRDPLDAAAVSTGAALVAAFGLFAAGPAIADLPTGIINAALSSNPIVSTASAAGVDLLRTDLLYRLSPLAHRRFEYPSWYSGLALYATLLMIFAAGTTRSLRKGWS